MADVSVRTLVAVFKDGVEQIGRAFTDPDEDWAPTLFYIEGNDAHTIALTDAMTSREDTKLTIGAIVPALIVDADVAVIALAIHLIELKDEIEGVRPSEHPHRRDGVVVCGADTSGVRESWRMDVNYDEAGIRRRALAQIDDDFGRLSTILEAGGYLAD